MEEQEHVINEELLELRNKEVVRLKHDAVEEVQLDEITRSTAEQYPYSERPSPYKVRLVGEKRQRRVYAAPIGNNAAYYLKTKSGIVYCELAVDAALHRV